MKPKVVFSLVILAFILHACNSEKKGIIGHWNKLKMSESITWYHFYKDGTYRNLVFEQESSNDKEYTVFKHGSAGYYKYIGSREFNLYPADIDFSPVIGKRISDPAIGMYFSESLDSQVELDLDGIEPSFLAEVQGDGENLHITQNGNVIISLSLREVKFTDKR
jgi:hypothetical protein